MDDEVVDLDIVGMTCTSCAQRIERKLNKLPGVSASVNYATESARIEFPATVSLEDLITTVHNSGYEAILPTPPSDGLTEAERAGEAEVRNLRLRFWVSLVLAVPVVLVSMVPFAQFPGWPWFAFALTTPVVFWGAWPFHRATLLNLRHGSATMDTLISLGTFAAYIWSVWALFFGGAANASMENMDAPHLYFEVAAAVPVFILAGRWFEARAKRTSSAALRSLLSLNVKDAAVLVDGVERVIPTSALHIGDVFVVRPGERIATDGVVVFGDSAVDESLVTGESVPVDVTVGSAVIGSTVNADGLLHVRATRLGDDTTVASIARLVTEAASGKAPIQRLADRVASVFVPIVIVIAIVTFLAWWFFSGDVQSAMTAAVAVLVIACPCALGLATPTALLVGTGVGAKLGIIIRGPQVLERTQRIDTMVFDKTGTITTGKLSVASVETFGVTADEVMIAAASVEAGSEHPVAKAIVAAAPRIAPVHEFVNERGLGVKGVVNGVEVRVGRPSWVVDGGVGEGIAVAWDGVIRGLITVSDMVRPSSASAIAELKSMGINPVLLTGDSVHVAEGVAADVGIGEVIADVLPAEKFAVVERLQGAGHTVAMVGDGVNDAAALTASDLGIAMGTGTDVAIEASDVTLMRSDLLAVVDAIRLARRTLAIIKGNLFWAFAYNVAMIPLAALGLLNPMWAGAAMAFSSVFVVLNSLRLRNFRSVVS